jgi:hypothetical protein
VGSISIDETHSIIPQFQQKSDIFGFFNSISIFFYELYIFLVLMKRKFELKFHIKVENYLALVVLGVVLSLIIGFSGRFNHLPTCNLTSCEN